MKKLLQLLINQPQTLCLSLISKIYPAQESRKDFKMNRSFLASLSIAMLFLGQIAIGQTLIEEQAFDGTDNPPGWTSTSIEYTGSYAKFLSFSSKLISPTYDLTNYTNVKLSFAVAKFGGGGNGPLTVDVSNDGGTTWTAQTFTSGMPTSSTYVLTTNKAITVTGSSVKFRISRPDSDAQRRFKDWKLEGTFAAPAFAPVVTGGSISGTVATTLIPYQISATNSPTSYAVATGTLPSGLGLNTTTGIISGTPTTAGSSSVTVTATNSVGTSAPATLNFTIAKANQTITFATIADKEYGDAVFNLSASTTSNLLISYTSSNTAVATISGSTVTIVGVGSTNITASQAGDTNYNAATNVVRTLNVTPKNLTITGITADNKQDDGTTAATLSGTPVLNGIVSGDEADVVISGTPSATFANAGPGLGIAVTVTGYTLIGSKAINYALTQPTGLTADIIAVGTPVATAATNIGTTTFTANWEAVAGATSYELDVFFAGAPGPTFTQTETFTDIGGGSSGSYLSRSWTGDGGITWTAGNARIDQVVNTGDDAITLKDQSGAFIESGEINNGVTEISFDVKQVFGGSGGILTVKILSGPGFATETLVDNVAYSTTLLNYVSDPITGITGDYKIRIDNNASARPAIDNLTFTSGSSTPSPTYVILAQNVGNVTSYDVTGLTAGTTYSYVVRAISGGTSPNSNQIDVTTTLVTSTTWDGTAWSNDEPTASIDAIIEGDLTMATDLIAKSLTINAGVLTVGANVTLTVVDNITNNLTADNFVIESDGVLLQNSSVLGNVSATVKRNSSNLYRQDYTSWSSPVAGQNMKAFSPATIQSRFYSYDAGAISDDPAANIGNYVSELVTAADVANKTFTPGVGILIRMPNNWPVFVDAATAGTPYNGVFKGTLNNGDYSVVLSDEGVGFNLVGNPYPSQLSISSFFAANPTIPEILYFWRKRNGAMGSGYATYSPLGTTSLQPEGTVTDLDDTIKAGQGFYVTANAPTTLIFNNAMRTNTSGTMFFKSASENPSTMSRFWLNLSSGSEVVGQMLVGYAENATQGVDSGLDAKYVNDSSLALTSLIETDEYSIQGRALPFANTDVVPLGFKSSFAGTFTISLAQFDGLFSANQDIFLKDNTTGISHDLKAGNYIFPSESGVFNNRFEIQYTATLNTTNPSLAENVILVGVQNQEITINAGAIEIQKVELIDVSGRIIYTLEEVNNSATKIKNLSITNQMLIVRISTVNNGVVNKKIIF